MDIKMAAMLLTLKEPGFFLGTHLPPKRLLRRVLPGVVHRDRNPEKVINQHPCEKEEKQIPQKLKEPEHVDAKPDHCPANRPQLPDHFPSGSP